MLKDDTDLSYVIDNGYDDCHRARDREEIIHQMKASWFPWALSDSGLLAGILLAACRSLAMHNPNDALYATLRLKYKSESIKAARLALSDKERSTCDFTIALVLLLASEEVRMLYLT